MSREIIRPNYGEPCLVQLASAPEGIQREGQHGVDYQYVLNDDQAITWLPKEARDAILQSGARQGDEICIRKSKRARTTVWEVQRVDVEPPPPPDPQPETHAQTALRRQAQTAQHIAAQCAAPTRGRETIAQANPPAPAPAPQLARPAAQALAGALCAAIDAAAEAMSYAENRHEWDLRLTADDVRALAITLYIDARKEAK